MSYKYLKGISGDGTVARGGDDGVRESRRRCQVVGVEVGVEVEVEIEGIREGRSESCSENGTMREAPLGKQPPPVRLLVPLACIPHGARFVSLCFAILLHRHVLFCCCVVFL